jgi:ribosomal protein S11
MFLQEFSDVKHRSISHLRTKQLQIYKLLIEKSKNDAKIYKKIYINLIDFLDSLKYSKHKHMDFINIFKMKRYLNKPYRYVNFHLRNTLSNYFITITDKQGNVLLSQTAGKVSFSNKKKQKVSPYVIRPMLINIFKLLKKYKIRNIHIIFRTKLTRHINNLLYYFRLSNVRIRKMKFLRKIPHHFGQRKQKVKRL